MKIYKLLADANCCAQFDSILHTVPNYCREYLVGCAGFVQSGRGFFTVCLG